MKPIPHLTGLGTSLIAPVLRRAVLLSNVSKVSLVLVTLMSLVVSPASAAIVFFVQKSVDDANGATINAVLSTQWLETAVTYTTATAPSNYSSYRFIRWSNNRQPSNTYMDAWGRSLNPISFVLYEDTICTAYYLASTRDTDGDGVPDWYEMEYYGSLTNGAASNTDRDEWTLLQEYTGGSHPFYANTNQPGRVVRTRSAQVTVNLEGYARYTFLSVPAGTVDQTAIATNGAVITTSNMTQSTFGYWTLDGVSQRDGWGVALRQFSFVMGSLDREAVAYLFSGDSDGDGLPDAWEMYYYGSLAHGSNDVLAGDGLTLLEKYQSGMSPVFGFAYQPGRVVRVRSAVVTANLQGFERITHVQVSNVYEHVFSFSPQQDLGWNFGENPSVGAGDWDADGDMDLFVVCSNTPIQILENVGSAYNMKLKRHSGYLDFLGHGPFHLALGDWSGDGRADLVVAYTNGELRFVSSWGSFNSGIPATDMLWDSGSSNVVPALGHFSDTNAISLLLWHPEGHINLHAHTGNNAAPYSATPTHTDILSHFVPNATGLAIADLDGAGNIGILVSDDEGRIWDFHQTAPDHFELQSKVWAGTGAGHAERQTLAAVDLDDDGDTDALLGFRQGGLMYLRDPRISIPSGLLAAGGPEGIRLEWAPNRQHQIVGYHVYRSTSETNGFQRLTDDPVIQPYYNDSAVQSSIRYYYRLTAISTVVFPGSSLPQYRESPPSRAASAIARMLRLWMPDYEASADTYALLQINAENASSLAANDFSVDITYDPSVMVPATQHNPTNSTVLKSALTQDFALTDNSAIANGILQIRCSGDASVTGEGKLFDISFRILSNVPVGTRSTNRIAAASMKDALGNSLNVDYADTAQFITISTAFLRGDVNADGLVNQADVTLILRLAAGWRTPTSYELISGDLNGNAKLDSGDAHLVSRIIQGLPLNP